jgi:hypothetical protein
LVVSNGVGSLESGTQRQLPLENRQRSWAQHDPPVFPSLRLTTVYAGDPRLVHADGPVLEIEVRQNKSNLFGRPHASEESELIIVALSLVPVAMDCGNQCFRILHTKRVDPRPVLLLEARVPGRYFPNGNRVLRRHRECRIPLDQAL